MNVAEKFVEKNLPGVLSGYDPEDVKAMDTGRLANELTEELDSILISRVEDADVVEMARGLYAEKNRGGGRDLDDANVARIFLDAEISGIVAKRVQKWDENGRRGDFPL